MGAQYTVLTPFPGTPLFAKNQENLLEKDFSKYDEFTPVVDIKTATVDEVENSMSEAYRYYFRWSWVREYFLRTFFRLMFKI